MTAKRVAAWLVVAPFVLLTLGCGSRLSTDRLLTYARGQQPGQAATGNGAVTGNGGVTSSGQPVAGVTSGNGVTAPGGTGATGGSGPAASSNGAGTSGTGTATNGQTTAGGTSSGGAAAAGCSAPKSTITIGSVGEQSGVLGQVETYIPESVGSWVSAMNAQGGLNCHPLRYLVEDDGGDPSLNQSLTQQLVEQDHVIAFVGVDAAVAGNASVAYLTQHQIPVIGSEGGSQWFYQSPVYFPQVTSADIALQALVAAMAEIGKPKGLTRLGSVTCIEVALCSSLYGKEPALAKQFGLTMAYRGQGSLTQPDFTSSCQAAQQANVQLFIAGLDTNSIERLIRDCLSIGFKPVYATGGPIVTPLLAADPQAEGFLVTSYTVPFINTANPNVAAMTAALKQYAPGVQLGPGTMTGWVAAMLFQVAFQHSPDPPTSASLLQALYQVKDDDLGGTTTPLTFTAGQTAIPTICFWTMQLHNLTYIQVGNPNRVCV